MTDPADLTRRQFLQTAGAAGAALSLGRELTAQAPARVSAGPAESQFVVRLDNGAIVSLKRRGDAFDTDYVQAGRRLGDVIVRYWHDPREWTTLQTVDALEREVTTSADATLHEAVYRSPDLQVKVGFTIGETRMDWRIALENLSDRPLVIGDLALPLLMNSSFQQQPTTAVLKHCLISGSGSFLFWMRRNSVGPYLTMTPAADTHLEYWESQGGYRVFVHSAAAGDVARLRGTKWRQPNTSLTLAPRGKTGASKAYGFVLHWAANYDGVRQILYDEGLFDVHVIPGMSVPSDLTARFALRTKQRIRAVEAEFPKQTTIRSLGANGAYQLYEVRFARLGENRLTVRYGEGRQFFLEFFSTEPVETLIAKRAAFIAAHQHRDPAKWYNGLLAEWNQESHVLLGPDNYDRIRGWRIYEVTCDDPGLSKPAYLSSKNALYPKQAEVSALDYYIEHFVWGGLQRTTEEEFPYGIYGIPDWKQNRESSDPGRGGRRHLWRIYDYPHIVLMYYSMYRVAKDHPHISTALRAPDYLKRAYGTAIALFTIPYEIERWSAYQTGLYNELVIVDLIAALDAEGLSEQAERLRMHWERKVRAFIADRPDLFRSEYAFDSTGFESTHALARYAVTHAERFAAQRPVAERIRPIPLSQIREFLSAQIEANIFCRGWIETAYYYLGSDYRGGAGNGYCLSYMSQMGGWSVLDYALHHAADPAAYLRLGYASCLSAWALMNTGTPESNYGFWYPGPENDGAAGGGFEPAPFGNTWLEQPHHRGSWYYSCEIDLGYCGALRGAATVLADDPVFGRVCFGGDWRKTAAGLEIVPKDGVRRRFHALIGGRKMHVTVINARFARGQFVSITESLSGLKCQLESDNPATHTARVQIVIDGRESQVDVPMSGGKGAVSHSMR
ncbi:MAG: DUF5695 domain-containing protein [Gemmatimonadota bacterium]